MDSMWTFLFTIIWWVMSRTDWVPWQLQDVHFLATGSQHDQVLHWQDWLLFDKHAQGGKHVLVSANSSGGKGRPGGVSRRERCSQRLCRFPQTLWTQDSPGRLRWGHNGCTAQEVEEDRQGNEYTHTCTCTPGGRKSSTTKGLTQNKTVRNNLINLFERSPDHELETYFEQTFPATPLPKLTTSLVVARMIRWAYLIILSFLFQGFKFWVIFCWREKWKMHI